ncbi:TIGR02611 family protein [Streptomyces liangshanensis]|uniref:TIGR02611 family protein n=1 Tax=Streptomyces liangshanensis TaxID=2717324 RepID=A0A6G9H5K4_9ACTN|nr:TIGR02611 family protein [Streptomyces liangshanensis]QIQ05724.1 TIGR02611 family protein [Streptomyces liangshanensis]
MHAESDERGESVVPTATTGDRKVESGAHPVRVGKTGEKTDTGTGGTAELGSRAPRFIKASKPLHLSWQVGVFIVGLAVVGGGIVLLPLPGPGWLIIFGGMAIWATEFVWAQLVLRWTKRKVTEAAQKAMDPKVRRRNIVLTSIGLVILAAAVAVYLWKFGWVLPWKIGD